MTRPTLIPTTQRPVDEALRTGRGSALISARSLVFSFDSTPALRGISLDITDGEILAVSGPSGSGKSTLLLCLAGILRPDAGEIRYGHKRIDKLSESERAVLRRSEFGVLFQFGQLVPELTAEENVALPLLLDGVRRRPALATARTWLERFGVSDLVAKRPGAVSGGQQQRIAVARAMVTEPRVLFADEPTGALDSLAGEAVLAQLTRVARDAGTTVVMVTHDATVAAYGDREIVIRDGMLDPTATDRTSRP